MYLLICYFRKAQRHLFITSCWYYENNDRNWLYL